MLELIGSDGDVWDRIDAPILGIISDGETTAFGWRGIMPDGHVREFRSVHPGVHADMPGGPIGILSKVRAPDGQLRPFLRDVSEGRLLGIYLIEPRGKRTRKRQKAAGDRQRHRC